MPLLQPEYILPNFQNVEINYIKYISKLFFFGHDQNDELPSLNSSFTDINLNRDGEADLWS